MNCMYWEADYPRLISNSQMRELIDSKNSRLLAVGDVTCDPVGGVEFLTKCSRYWNPTIYSEIY